MDKNNTPVSMVAEIVDVAEHTNYLEMTSRICYYGEPNLNNDMLVYDDTTQTKAESLISMPVQAKYRVNSKGEPSLGGHEMHKRKDNTVYFATESIGVHTAVEIKNDNVVLNDGTIKELPCLFASYRIWKRYPNYVAAIKRLYENNALYGSWEISTYKYEYDNGIRKITDYEFFANTLLGESNPPSYGVNATALSMAETCDNNPQLLVAEALSQDIISQGLNIDNNNKEENAKMAKENDTVIAEGAETVTPNDTNSDAPVVDVNTTTAEHDENIVENTEEPTTDLGQLTTGDLRTKISKAIREKYPRDYIYVSFIFPEEREVWCKSELAKSELDFLRFTYEVNGDDVSVSDGEEVKLTVTIPQVNATIASLEKEVETVKAELEIKNDAITKASEKIQELNVQISELTPFKDQVEAAEHERIETEIAEEKERLKAKLLKGNLFTETEIAEKNIADLIEARNESAINSLIADRFVASFDSKKNDEPDGDVTTEKNEQETATASLESDDEDTDIRSFMSKILF